MYLDSNLIQLIHKHTRYRINNNPSLLDLILCNDENLVTNIEYLAPIGKCDDPRIIATVQIEVPHILVDSKIEPVQLYRDADYDTINAKILQSRLLEDKS